MKTSIPLTVAEATNTLMHRILIGLLLGTVLAPPTMAADTDESFQLNALFKPTQNQLMAEARGRVVIYDGLENEVVERAFDTQFDRIEQMMFIRIQHTQPDGEIIVEDDGC